MKHIILAAGKGSRLLPMTFAMPKVLFDLGDGTTNLLCQQIEVSLRFKEITAIVVVAGYRHEMIQEIVALKYAQDQRIRVVINPYFEINNPLYSIREGLGNLNDQDLLITNGDVYYAPEVLEKLVLQNDGVTLAVSHHRDLSPRAMSVVTDGDKLVTIGYGQETKGVRFESPGIVVVRGSDACKTFGRVLKELLVIYEGKAHFWHDLFNVMKNQVPVTVMPIGRNEWAEVDDPESLLDAREMYAHITERDKR